MPTQHPLTRFSRYLGGRHDVVDRLAAEIVARLDADDRGRASDLMWLWNLGAYEVVRTMCQAAGCFAPALARELSALKVALERVRVPNTKMERIKYDRKERGVPVPSDREADAWDQARRDLWVGDPADVVSARGLLALYGRVMGSMRAEDVLGRHEDSFG